MEFARHSKWACMHLAINKVNILSLITYIYTYFSIDILHGEHGCTLLHHTQTVTMVACSRHNKQCCQKMHSAFLNNREIYQSEWIKVSKLKTNANHAGSHTCAMNIYIHCFISPVIVSCTYIVKWSKSQTNSMLWSISHFVISLVLTIANIFIMIYCSYTTLNLYLNWSFPPVVRKTAYHLVARNCQHHLIISYLNITMIESSVKL